MKQSDSQRATHGTNIHKKKTKQKKTRTISTVEAPIKNNQAFSK